ncbi:hypothetical protein [Candidatus Pyrohabitans sp.]
MSATLTEILNEIKLLRKEIRELKDMLIPEVQPEEDEVVAIEDYERRKRSGDVELTPLEGI